MRTKLFIGLAVIIAIVLIASIFKTVKQQQQTKTQTAFHTIYDAAEKDYTDGTGLLSLNPAFARDDFLAAKKKLEDGIAHFPKGSTEEQQLTTLLQKVNSQLGTSTTNTVKTTSANKTDTPLLAALQESGNLFAANDDGTMYTLTSTDILKDGKSIYKNDKDWSTPAGFAAYHGNIYVLDKKNGVLKFVSGSDGYGKTDYFTDSKPDLSQASGMAIDGSVWLLFADGRIQKFTKGQQEEFSVIGMDKLLSNPAVIFTETEGNNLYILDKANSRIVVIGKDGMYKKAYAASSLANARAIDANEKESTLYILSKDTLLKIAL
jgi:hypothetical protein